MTTANNSKNVDDEFVRHPNTPKHIPIPKIIKSFKKTGSVLDIAKLLGITRQAIYTRFKRAKINYNEELEY